jgi:hypothetical protein
MAGMSPSSDAPTFTLLEEAIRYGKPSLEELLFTYRKHSQSTPLWSLLEDAHRLTFAYTNALEALKGGETAEKVKARLQDLDLLPKYPEIPNPNAARLVQWLMDKLGDLKRVLVEFLGNRGGELLNELGVELGGTVGITLSLSFPPSVDITFEHTATAQTTVRFPSRG